MASELVHVSTSQDGSVRTVTLDRPERRNALNPEMLDQLSAAFSAEPSGDERVTVIRAIGQSFCSGVDLKERQSNGMAASADAIESMLDAVQNYPLPVLGVVQGDAIAGGNELALHCDLVVAASTARFGMSLAQIGLAPTWFLAKKILEVGGPVFAREMLLLGDPVSRAADGRSRADPAGGSTRRSRGRGPAPDRSTGSQCSPQPASDEGRADPADDLP